MGYIASKGDIKIMYNFIPIDTDAINFCKDHCNSLIAVIIIIYFVHSCKSTIRHVRYSIKHKNS
jgi:hypothetical protein